jgi:UDP-N-acetylmuramyl pentapeptide phosphotransferase/UDP-N-acetylglucosamine-1-phosphate transferase
MTGVLLWLGAAAIAAVVTARTLKHLAVTAPLRALNYRGLSVPSGAGIAVVIGIAVALGFISFLDAIFDSNRLAIAHGQTLTFVLVASAFALLGLWDDVTGTAEERGWRAHIDAARRGRATAGSIKLVVGSTLAFAFGSVPERSLLWAVIAALVIATSANAYNLFDVRPGRACKLFVLAIVALILVPGPVAVTPLAAALGAVLAFLPYDLRERAMLGDTGAMALGAFVGWGIVATGSHLAQLIALAVFALMHVIADRPGISAVIDAVPPLRVVDRAGRVAE